MSLAAAKGSLFAIYSGNDRFLQTSSTSTKTPMSRFAGACKPIVIEPLERYESVLVSSSSRPTAITSGPHDSLTSPRQTLTSASGQLIQALRRRDQLQQQAVNPLSFTLRQDNATAPIRSVALRSVKGRPPNQQQLVCVGSVANNGVTRTLFIERTELPMSSAGVRRNANSLQSRPTTVTTTTVKSLVPAASPQSHTANDGAIFRRQQPAEMVAATTRKLDRMECSQSCAVLVSNPASVHTISLQDSATAASLTAALAAHLPSRNSLIVGSPTSAASSTAVETVVSTPDSSLQQTANGSLPQPPEKCEPSGPARSLSTVVVGQSALGKRKVTVTSFPASKHVASSSSVFRSILPQSKAVTCSDTSSSDLVGNRSATSADPTDEDDDDDDDDDNSWPMNGGMQRQFHVRLTPNASTSSTEKTSSAGSSSSHDFHQQTPKEWAGRFDSWSSTALPRSPKLTTRTLDTGGQFTDGEAVDLMSDGEVQTQDNRHTELRFDMNNNQCKQQYSVGQGLSHSNQRQTDAVFNTTLCPSSSPSLPVSTSATASLTSALPATVSHNPVAVLRRGSTTIFSVASGQAVGQQTMFPVHYSLATDSPSVNGAHRWLHNKIVDCSSRYATILPSTTTSSIPLPVLSMSGYGSAVSAVPEPTYQSSEVPHSKLNQQPLTANTHAGLPRAIPAVSSSVSVIQHAPGLKSSSVIFPAGQPLICMPHQLQMNNASSSGLLQSNNNYSNLQLQSFAVVPSSTAIGFRPSMASTTILPLNAISMFQPVNCNQGYLQQQPQQHFPCGTNVLHKVNTSSSIEANTAEFQLPKMPTMKPSPHYQQQQFSIKQLSTSSLSHAELATANHLDNVADLPPHQSNQQHEQVKPTSAAATTEMTEQSTTNSSPSAAPYYLRRCRSRVSRAPYGGRIANVKDETDTCETSGCKPRTTGNSYGVRRRLSVRFIGQRRPRNGSQSSTLRPRSSGPGEAASDAARLQLSSPVNVTSRSSSDVDELEQPMEQQSEDMSKPPLAMLEALCLRINVNSGSTSST